MSNASQKTAVATVKEGQSVKFIPRDASSEARVVPYYDFYSGLKGDVSKIYDDGTAAVVVDRASLPDDARERHLKSESDMRDKWLRGLSEEDRGKLTDAQRQFNLRYTLLVNVADLIDIGAKSPIVPTKVTTTLTDDAEPTTDVPVQPVNRPTETDIAAAEAAHLEELRRRAEQG